jgi:hypothetical protein
VACQHYIEAIRLAEADAITLSVAKPGESKKAIIKCPVEGCEVFASACALNGNITGAGLESIAAYCVLSGKLPHQL